MSRRWIAVLILPVLLACDTVTSLLPPGPTPTRPAPVTLPPTYTPTPPPRSSPTPPATPTALTHLSEHAAALRPAFAADLASHAHLTRYWIEVDVDLDLARAHASLDGQARIRYTNPLDDQLEDVVLMLWPNDGQYDAEMTAGPVLVDGVSVEPRAEMGGIALRIPLPVSLAPGALVDLSLPFHIDVDGLMTAEAPRRFAITQGVLIAPTFYPLVPRLVDDAWQVEPAPPGGDTTNSDAAYYDLQITASAEFALAVSGAVVDTVPRPDGRQTVRVVTGPVRDVALALGPLVLEEREVDGVLLRAWVLPDHASDLRRMLGAAETQLRALSEWIGPYPYTELDLVDAPGAFGGIEYPGLVYIGTLGSSWIIEPVVHEVGHQWFYGLIGSDQLEAPWLDEAAASYTEVLYYEAAAGPERGTTLLREFHDLVEGFADRPQTPIGLPVGEYASESEYALIVYDKGALFFDALRRQLGDDAFFRFLQEYFQAYRYGFAEPSDFARAAESTCGCDLDPVFDLWVDEGGPLPGP